MKEAKQKTAKKPSDGSNNGSQEDRLLSLKNLPSPQRREGEQLIDKVFSPFTFHFSLKRTATRIIRGVGGVTSDRHHTGWVSFADTAPYRKFGFTLAEVLITLGIIGVVAAMTMPVLINKYQEQVTINKVKKFYSMINQALLMSIKDNGYVDEWQYSNVTEFADYLKPYLKIIKDCGTQSGCITTDKYKFLNGGYADGNYGTSANFYKMILTDNSYIWFRKSHYNNSCIDSDGGWSGVCGVIEIDVNGKKEPNTIGKDMFVFYIQKNRIVPWNLNNIPSWAEQRGWACSAYILKNGKMDYLYK